jgi:lysyl-tRNA synthetase class 1
MMNTEAPNNYWLELAADAIIERYPEGTITVSSGISPSANYHVGHFREILTAEALAWAVRQRGRTVKHVHVVDNFDPLRKRYDFLPEWLEEFVGRPICLVPSPDKSEDISYADHFFNEFIARAHEMGVEEDLEVVKSYEELYKPNRMVRAIEDSLASVDEIKAIFAEISNRKLEADWSPVQVLNAKDEFEQGEPSTWDKTAQTINGLSYTDGRAKLNWRLDWPARWRELGVQVEPFSYQEHGAAGSSYDTGKEFSRRVFNYPAPYPGAQYGNIHLIGDTKKMSSSKGNLITPREALQIMPPEILRYFVVRSRPEKTLYFDSGLGFYSLVNEYKEVMRAVNAGEDSDFADAYKFASDIKQGELLSTAPFQQIVTAYQTARGDQDRTEALLRRIGWEPVNEAEIGALRHELIYVKNWLDNYAPEDVKFEVQEAAPTDLEVGEDDRAYLTALAGALPAEWEGEALQSAIFQTAKDLEFPPRDAFRLLYRLFIAKDAGPKLGPFLTTLERDFVLTRLQEGVK